MTWKDTLQAEKSKDYFKSIQAFLARQTASVYPPSNHIFNALKLTPLDQIKVVIIGQDPYHGPGQAHGLAFSVPKGVKTPPSLVNIYKEIAQSTKTPIRKDGNLEDWAEQGVFLLNTVLTVEAHQAHSHANIGWEIFTDSVIQTISDCQDFVVFLLWGAHAQKKQSLIDASKHQILTSSHPSPLSAHRGFIGCNHFNLANEALQRKGISPIVWASK